MIKTAIRIPSAVQLYILEYSGFCPRCHTYDNHKLDSCAKCDDFMCEQYGDIIWLLGDTNFIICRKCILKKMDDLQSNYHFTVRSPTDSMLRIVRAPTDSMLRIVRGATLANEVCARTTFGVASTQSVASPPP